MRRILAAAALAAAALGITAPAASAGCYGVQDVAVACTAPWDPNPQVVERQVACVYTGGTTCDPVYAPWVSVNPPPDGARVCIGDDPIGCLRI